MREITKEVLDGTYPKPLGRGVLRWRVYELAEGETKHIVEVCEGHFAYACRNGEVALIQDVDVLNGNTPNFTGIADVLGVKRVLLYARERDDAFHARVGMRLISVGYSKKGPFHADPPPGLELNTVMTEQELKDFLESTKTSVALQRCLADIGEGRSLIHRLKRPTGDGLMVVYDHDNHLTLETYVVFATQDVAGILEAYNYLASTATVSRYTIPVNDVVDFEANYLLKLGFTAETYTYGVDATTPKGETNAD